MAHTINDYIDQYNQTYIDQYYKCVDNTRSTLFLWVLSLFDDNSISDFIDKTNMMSLSSCIINDIVHTNTQYMIKLINLNKYRPSFGDLIIIALNHSLHAVKSEFLIKHYNTHYGVRQWLIGSIYEENTEYIMETLAKNGVLIDLDKLEEHIVSYDEEPNRLMSYLTDAPLDLLNKFAESINLKNFKHNDEKFGFLIETLRFNRQKLIERITWWANVFGVTNQPINYDLYVKHDLFEWLDTNNIDLKRISVKEFYDSLDSNQGYKPNIILNMATILIKKGIIDLDKCSDSMKKWK